MKCVVGKESEVDEIVVTNTVPLERQNQDTHKIRTVDISILLAEAIRSETKIPLNAVENLQIFWLN